MGGTSRLVRRLLLQGNILSQPSTTKHANKRNGGFAIVEFSIVITMLLFILFTIIDFALFGYVKLTMQHAVREGARYAVTGRSDLDPDPGEDGPLRKNAVLEKISTSSLGVITKVMDVTEIRVEDINGNQITSGFGDPGELVSIHLDCEWPIISPLIYPFVDDGVYKFTVSAAMKNEDFSEDLL